VRVNAFSTSKVAWSKLARMMRFQATHDPMTALWDRGVIEELLAREIDRSRRENTCTVVMLCDADHFKRVNDEFGHNTGDDVLRELAQRLQRSVRSYDMVGRYGEKSSWSF
jgi:two-component system cell cycle response regulator